MHVVCILAVNDDIHRMNVVCILDACCLYFSEDDDVY